MAELLKDKMIGFIGGGNMAQAIGFGLIRKGLFILFYFYDIQIF